MGIDHVVDSVALAHAAALVEEVLLFGHEPVDDRRRVDLEHIVLQLGALGRELSPIEISLPVVVDENGRIDLRDSLDGPAVAERTGRSVGHGHALVDRIAHTVIEVVLAVLVSGVRRVQLAVAVRHFVVRSFRCEGVAMDRPVLQVVRRQQIVSPRAIEVGAFVSRNIKIEPSVLPLVSFRIGSEHAGRYDRILSAQGTSEQGGNREPFLSYHLITGFWLGSFRSGTVFSPKPGFPPRLGRGAVGP